MMLLRWLRESLYPVEALLSRVWDALPPVRTRAARQEAKDRDLVMLDSANSERRQFGGADPRLSGLATRTVLHRSRRGSWSLRWWA